MSSRTRVPYWRPPLREALRLAWRPALVYAIFSGLGAFVMLLTIASYNHNDREMPMFVFGLIVGMGGMFLGQALSLMRIRAAPVFIGLFLTVLFGMWVAASAHGGGDGGEYIAIATLFFCAAFPSGMLSMMHRYELFASFWPAVGSIGSVFIILNEEDRIRQWEQSKITAWLPVPLFFLACFLVLWLLYLAAKQAVRVELWQALSGAAQRRIAKQQKKERVSAVPRKNFGALLIVAALLFVAVAVLAPYLWRTGKGEHGSKPAETESHDGPPKAPNLDGDAIVKMLQQMANAAKQTLPKLWPLLFLIVLYRPAKRALLLTHLRAPLVPSPPSERIDNLWEYVRIHAEDTGLVPTSSDSVEELVRRIDDAGRGSKALTNASEIYIRTRYGFVVQPGDAQAMKTIAFEAASGLRQDLSPWMRVRSWWRPLS